MSSHDTRSPACIRCTQPMVWASEQIVSTKPVQVFHCEPCDKYAAVANKFNDVRTVLAPPLVASM